MRYGLYKDPVEDTLFLKDQKIVWWTTSHGKDRLTGMAACLYGNPNELYCNDLYLPEEYLT